MSGTVIGLDGDAWEAAAKVLGTSTKRDTVNTAQREIVARNRRLRALRDPRDFADEGNGGPADRSVRPHRQG
ncbi:type II toxin-antitoxin system VapB family antitoxin [Streptomyces sp. NPDC046977]|uniref:type II toxin-antitoxin system VapB family antitoxin n=1 Tax=Streptomyces sp. NPDC046977 TaxID=3154703 RepID=UPI0033DCD1B8